MIDKVFAAADQGIINPAIPGLVSKTSEQAVGGAISALVGLILVSAGLLSFGMLLIGSVQVITSGGDKGSLESARNRILHAIVGLILVASSWALITLILGKFLGMSFPTLNIPTIGGTTSTGGGGGSGGGTGGGGGKPAGYACLSYTRSDGKKVWCKAGVKGCIDSSCTSCHTCDSSGNWKSASGSCSINPSGCDAF